MLPSFYDQGLFNSFDTFFFIIKNNNNLRKILEIYKPNTPQFIIIFKF